MWENKSSEEEFKLNILSLFFILEELDIFPPSVNIIKTEFVILEINFP